MPNVNSFNNVFGGTAIQPSQVSYASYSIPPNLVLFWPSTGISTSSIVADNIDITTTAANATVTMPDATQVSTGQSVFFSNLGANAFSVLDFDGGLIASVPVANVNQNNWIRILLIDNTTQAGVWHIAQLGATTGAPQPAALAGNGLVALSGRLNTNVPIVTTNASPYTFQVSDRAKCYVYTGGQATYTLPAANTFPNGWFVGIANRSADGQLTVTSTSLIDGSNNLVLAIDQDCYIFTDGIKYTTFGLGTLTFFLASINQTQLVNNASVTLTPLQATKQIQIVTGTQNQDTDFIFPNINGIYYVSNQTDASAFSLKVKATGGAIVTTVDSGQRYIFVNDGTEMRSYPTSVADVKFPDGNAADPGIAFAGGPTTGFFLSTGGDIGGVGIGGSVNGTQVLNMNGGGLVLVEGGGISLNNDANTFAVIHSATSLLASNAEYKWPAYPAANGDILSSTTAGALSWVTTSIPSSSAKYIVQTADGSLPNAQALSALTTGLMKVTTTTGVVTTAVAGTDYQAASPRLADVAGFNTTKGGIVTANSTNLVQLAVGTDGQVLTAASGQADGLQWTNAFANPMTTAADMVVGGAAGIATRLAKGTANQVLAMNGGATAQAWTTLAAIPSAAAKYIVQTADASITNAQALSALTTGLMKVTTTTGVVTTAVAGTDYQAASPRLADVAGYAVTKGSVSVADGTNLAQIAVGTNGQVLTAASGQTTGVQWVTPTAQILPQIIQGILNTGFNTGAISGSTYVDITGLSASISPASTSSNVLITVNVMASTSVIAGDSIGIRITRNGTPIGLGTGAGTAAGSASRVVTAGLISISYSFLDSPASVSAQAYQVQAAALTGSTIYVNISSLGTGFNTVSTIILQEVLG
jgi:hypothetical protein